MAHIKGVVCDKKRTSFHLHLLGWLLSGYVHFLHGFLHSFIVLVYIMKMIIILPLR